MPHLFQTMTVVVAGLPLAETEPSAVGLPFSIFALAVIVGWVLACLYLAQRAGDSPLVPNAYRSAIQVASLWLGPAIFLALVLSDTKRTGKTGNPLVDLIYRLRDATARIWHSQDVQETSEDSLRLFDATGNELREIQGHGQHRGEDRSSFELTVQLIDQALIHRASDILIDPKDTATYLVRLRIDGMLRNLREVPSDACRAVINSIKAVSNMDISERRRPQDGAFTARRGTTTVSFRVASAGALNGEKLSVRVLNHNAGRFTLVDAGIPERQRALITEAVNKPSGMVLVCGPTGSGKTTTLYSMLNQIDRLSHNVITVEDPIEAFLPEASQLEINPKAGITFAAALRSILRQDPDVICVGEIRDEETAEIALRAAQTGHLVLATIHCDSNATALIRLLDLGISPMLLSSGLSLVLSQRLLRRLCEHCKRPAELPQNVAQNLRQKGVDVQKLFESVGCEHCGGTGYFGRTAICDLLPVTNDLRAAIAQDATIANKLKADGERQGRSNLRTEAFRRAVAGVTSLEEIKRVVG
ncbi:MAG: GspE/PulE family protein [Thermoguttaceae bacterium]